MAFLQAVQLIEKSATWPCRPFLPMTHTTEKENGLPKLGLIYEPYGGMTVFCGVSLYDTPMFGGELSEQEFLQTKQTYDSYESLLSEWQVD